MGQCMCWRHRFQQLEHARTRIHAAQRTYVEPAGRWARFCPQGCCFGALHMHSSWQVMAHQCPCGACIGNEVVKVAKQRNKPCRVRLLGAQRRFCCMAGVAASARWLQLQEARVRVLPALAGRTAATGNRPRLRDGHGSVARVARLAAGQATAGHSQARPAAPMPGPGVASSALRSRSPPAGRRAHSAPPPHPRSHPAPRQTSRPTASSPAHVTGRAARQREQQRPPAPTQARQIHAAVMPKNVVITKRSKQYTAALEQQLAHLQLEADALQTVHSALSIEHEVLHGVAEGLAWLRAHLQQQRQPGQPAQPAPSSAGSSDAALQLLQQELQLLEGLSQHAPGMPAPTPDDGDRAYGLPVDAPSAPSNDPMRTFRRLIAAPIDVDWQHMTAKQLQDVAHSGSQQLVLLLNMRDTPVYSEPHRRQELDARVCSILNRNAGLLAHLVAGKRSRVVMQRFWTPEWVHPVTQTRLTQDEVEALHACALQHASPSTRQLHVLAACSKLHHRLVRQLAAERVQAQAVLRSSCSDGPSYSGGSDGGCASGGSGAVCGSPRGGSNCERNGASGSSFCAALLREEAEDAALQQVHYTLEKEHLLANVVIAYALGCLSPLQCAQITAKVFPVPFNMHLVCKAAAAQLAGDASVPSA